MRPLVLLCAVGGLFALVLGLTGAVAQPDLVAELHASGLINLRQGEQRLAQVEFSAHGPDWQHAPQARAKAEVSEVPNVVGARRIVGTLPVPNTEGGEVKFTETVTTIEKGLALQYDLSFGRGVTLNGLQTSVMLDVTRFAGKTLTIRTGEGEAQEVALPEEADGEKWQLWTGAATKVEVAADTPEAMTVVPREAAQVAVQDLRRWGQAWFEIRLAAITSEQGKAVTADDTYDIDFTITFAGPIKLQAP